VSDARRLVAKRYLVGEILGHGGMADVHRGTDTRLGRAVAIKFLKPTLATDPAFRARFRQEARAASRMTHPTVVRVFDAGEESVPDGHGATTPLPYIVMEYVDGIVLRDLIAAGPLKPLDAIRVADGILTALEYSHRAGVVHRDIKPGNVMITHGGQVKVMDFGIARALSAAASPGAQTASILGTAGYFSPEQARGEPVDARTDLYSTGVVLFELLTGKPPFVGKSAVEVARRHVLETPPAPSGLNPAISPEIDAVVSRALAKDREARFQSAREFRSDLDLAAHPRQQAPTRAATVGMLASPKTTTSATAAATPVRATPVPDRPARPPRDRAGRNSSRHRGTVWLWSAVFATLAATLAAGAFWFLQVRSHDATSRSSHRVPALTGLSYQHAVHELKSVHLEPHRTAKASTTVAAGHVVSIIPRAGTIMAQGETVTLIVSTGPAMATVPDVRAMRVEAAEGILSRAAFTPGAIDRRDSPDAAGGTVMNTQPEPGSRKPAGTVIDLIVSSGTVYLPDLVGEDVFQAADQLRAADLGLNAHLRADPTCPTSQPAVVAAQSLAPGEVAQHAVVTLSYCTG
jgi:serine/threonine-protein kinase